MAKCDIAFKLTIASVTSGVATGRIAERSVVRGPATSVSSWRHRLMNAARYYEGSSLNSNRIRSGLSNGTRDPFDSTFNPLLIAAPCRRDSNHCMVWMWLILSDDPESAK